MVTATALTAALLGVAACTAQEADPDRAGSVVVAVDAPFRSLNAATVEGRAPGSVLVRGLVQSGFVALEPDGSVTEDRSFGTVEKVADDPLTVRYTIAPTATWSDGVPVTPADLLLEWAARSGQLDEVVPELGPDGLPADPAALDDVVAFAATSPALAHATALPVVDGATVTVVYDRPVADWRLALDVNLPAHVVGRLALDPTAPSATATASATASPSATATPSATASPSATATPSDDGAGEAARWADAVVDAVQQQDREALVPLSRAWRTAAAAGDVAGDPTLTTTTGPYVLDRVGADGVEAVRNEAYRGDRPARYDRVLIRTDLDPLAQLDAVEDERVDVAAPLVTPDVLDAAQDLEDAVSAPGGDAVLQLLVQQGGGGAFDPAAHPEAADPAAAAAALRTAFLAAVPRDEVADAVAEPFGGAAQHPDLVPGSDVVAAEAGPEAPPAPVADAAADAGAAPAGDEAVTVRVLANTDDPLRARAVEALAAAAQGAGFAVVPADVDDPVQALRADAGAWDVALVPVPQADLPVATFASRWRTGGATNVTAHADAALDARLDALEATADPAAARELLTGTSESLLRSGAVLPLVRTPALTVVADRDGEEDDGLPVLEGVGTLAPSRADQTSWWGWARTDG
ncbi:ABC transporter substrate-binding protein [Cellulomonas sp.]|uniref:ABC transporter substrate-binding protein n=1 Tax=Cellulomonas sp. TaxID=40001 RepID=UPI00281149AA|nr:ABC transporter substrate-binding protein [Cellulomonas sp.]